MIPIIETATPEQIFAQQAKIAARADDVWRALRDLFQVAVGARLFTVMTVDLKRSEGRRLYSSDASNYPVSGAKPLTVNPWYEQVVVRQESFVANTLEAIAGHFPDHALIGSLGCGSVINLPVLVAGNVVATVNCLDAEQHYTIERVAAAEALGLQAQTAYLLSRYLES